MGRVFATSRRRWGFWTLLITVAAAGLVALFGPQRNDPTFGQFFTEMFGDAFYDAAAKRVVSVVAKSEAKAPEEILCARGEGWSTLSAAIRPLGGKEEFSSLDVIDVGDRPLLIAAGKNLILSWALIDDVENPDTLIGLIAYESGHGFFDHRTTAFAWDLALKWPTGSLRRPSFQQPRDRLDLWSVTLLMTAQQERAAQNFAIEKLRAMNIDPNNVTTYRTASKPAGPEPSPLTRYRYDHPGAELKGFAEAVEPGTTEPALTQTEWQMVKSLCAEKRRQK